MIYPILALPTAYYPTLAYYILSYPGLSYPFPIQPCLDLSYPVILYPTLSWSILSCPVLSYPDRSNPILSCPTITYPIQLYVKRAVFFSSFHFLSLNLCPLTMTSHLAPNMSFPPSSDSHCNSQRIQLHLYVIVLSVILKYFHPSVCYVCLWYLWGAYVICVCVHVCGGEVIHISRLHGS